MIHLEFVPHDSHCSNRRVWSANKLVKLYNSEHMGETPVSVYAVRKYFIQPLVNDGWLEKVDLSTVHGTQWMCGYALVDKAYLSDVGKAQKKQALEDYSEYWNNLDDKEDLEDYSEYWNDLDDENCSEYWDNLDSEID